MDQLAEQSAEAAGLKGEDFVLETKFKVKSMGAGENAYVSFYLLRPFRSRHINMVRNLTTHPAQRHLTRARVPPPPAICVATSLLC